MNKAQILALMMRTNQQNAQTDLLSITELMAETLADVTDRLSEDEFYRFIGIGAAIYSHGLMQFTDDIDDEPLPADERSASETGMGGAGFRGRH
jgi:hypothetical protein